MNKKVGNKITYLLILIVLCITLTGCTNKNNNTETMQEKINSELSLLDKNLIDMLNKTNGISLENYIVQAQKVESSNTKSSTSNDNSTSSKENSSSESSSGGNSNQQGGDGEESNNSNSSNNFNYKMVGNEILLQKKETDWDALKSSIEKLYLEWETIVLDLYKANVSSQEILSFNSDLDIAASSIQSEDKIKTLTSLAKLYSYIPKYSSAFVDNAKISNIYQTKSNILNAYTLIEQDDFSKINDELKSAETSFMPILNDMSSNIGNQNNINRAYILIKELQNYNATTGKDVFYIKYKNVIQNLNNIKL